MNLFGLICLTSGFLLIFKSQKQTNQKPKYSDLHPDKSEFPFTIGKSNWFNSMEGRLWLINHCVVENEEDGENYDNLEVDDFYEDEYVEIHRTPEFTDDPDYLYSI